MPNQTGSGKAWEYGLARQFANAAGVAMVVNRPSYQSQTAYDLLPATERQAVDRAANEAMAFLRAHDTRLANADRVLIQSDQMGQDGDVRDILVITRSGEIVGISAKHRHLGLKHSRLSDTIDFGAGWYGEPCSNNYWNAVQPVFNSLRTTTVRRWNELPRKHEDYYVPILEAFIDEVRRNANVERMLRYVIGRFDVYRIIKANGSIQFQSFNLTGNLRWGRQLPMPTRIVEFAMRNRSTTTADLTLDHGWALSFRIHNANSRIEPSLKFDVLLTGSPAEMGNHEIPYG